MTQYEFDSTIAPFMKEWIRENLVIQTSYTQQFGPDESMDVEISFVGERTPFTYATVSIPERD